MFDVQKLTVGPVRTNCYILDSAGAVLAIDPGGDAADIEAVIGSRRLVLIVLTHFHYDHHLACLELKEAYPEAAICLHQDDRPYLSFRPDRLLQAGDCLEFGQAALQVIHTPGHSPGGICLAAGQAIFTGDTLFADGLVGRTDLPGSSAADLEKSIGRLRREIKPQTRVYPGHGRDFVWP